jgi:SAM-dependent methyltransferase
VSTSLIYRTSAGYELVMRALYGRHYAARMRVVAQRIPANASVLELCCGPGTLYKRYLRGHVGSYTGLDLNEGFVARLRREGVDARRLDLAQDGVPLPRADVVLIQASLYHFLPDPTALLERMLAAARDRVIVAEPVRNLASSQIPLIRSIGSRGTDPGGAGNSHEQRFTEATLDALMERYLDRRQETFLIPGGREKVYVLAGG